ncbi:MAG: DUF4340 domain-containing protein [Thermoguttaceae bacterium]|jgi:hypothetical protein
MHEFIKTLIFVVVAAVVGVGAVLSNRPAATPAAQNMHGQLLYPDFKNPQKVASLEVVKFDETRGEVHPFTVAQVKHAGKGPVRWSIPSHEDYPADAKDQVATAATALMGLKIIDMVSDNKDDEREYGVVDPPKTITPGVTGVGQRMTMRDGDGKELLDLIVGKEVPEKPDLRYVRKVGESEIYIVAAKTDKLSTKFEDWIEPNLLQINTFDLKDVLVHDYAIQMDLDGLGIVQRDKIKIAYNDSGEPHWKMVEDQQFVPGKTRDAEAKWVPVKMADNEQLNATKLDDLKSALDDLKIGDVSRKPAGLRADLKVMANFTSNAAAVQSLAKKGFYAARADDGVGTELFSNEGEIHLLMKNGVEYVLRFGQITGSGPAKDAGQKGKAKDADKAKEGSGLNRYLLVMAEFNPSAVAKPQPETLPEPAKAKQPEKKPDEKAAKDAKAAKKPEPQKPATDAKALEAERARIEKENKRKQEEYDQQIADGTKKVKELNARFADWYYVISDEVYRKIHLGRDEIVMKKPKKEPEKGKDAGGNPPTTPTPIDQLEKLKNEGLGGK